MVPGMSWSLLVYPGAKDAAQGVADRLVELSREALQRGPRFTLAVSGGRTPVALYGLLAESYGSLIRWADTDLYFADERAVPPEDPRSNYGLVQRTWLDHMRGSGLRVHRIPAERTPIESGARQYEDLLRSQLKGPASGPPVGPTFDAILLGVGSDGHTASLFPNAASLSERDRWTVVEPSPHLDPHVPRISLSFPVICSARHALFLVCGADKQPIIQKIFDDRHRGTPEGTLPSARVYSGEGVEWFLDSAAAPRTLATASR